MLGEYWALLGPYWSPLGPYWALLGEGFRVLGLGLSSNNSVIPQFRYSAFYSVPIYSDVAARRVNQNTLQLSWSASSLEDNLDGRYVAEWILLPKSFRLSYLTPSLPLLVFAVQRDEDRELIVKTIHPKKHQRDQNSIAIILEHHSVNNVKKL